MLFSGHNTIMTMKTENQSVTSFPKPVSRVCDGIFLLIKDGQYRKFLYADILYVEASGSNCLVYSRGQSRLMVTCRLNLLEAELPEQFVRVHRGHLLNVNHVDVVTKTSLRIGDKCFPVGETYRRDVFRCFHIYHATSNRRDVKTSK